MVFGIVNFVNPPSIFVRQLNFVRGVGCVAEATCNASLFLEIKMIRRALIFAATASLIACTGSGGVDRATSESLRNLDVTTLPSGVQRVEKSASGNRVLVHVLDDELIHIHYGSVGTSVSLDELVTDMVAQVDYDGAEQFSTASSGFYTDKLKVSVDDALCVTLNDSEAAELSKICPQDVTASNFTLAVNSSKTNQAYGLGEQFFNEGQNGDWLGRVRVPGNEYGNRMVGFEGGAVGNLQIPVLLTYQPAGAVGYFVDSVEAQQWDLTQDTWSISSRGPGANMFVFTGDQLPDVRKQYLDLTGKSPVPPKAAFGLWLSEYGYDNWSEAESKIAAQHNAQMPVDGVVLDLQWFGGIDDRHMGSLTWDTASFPEPKSRLSAWQDNWGVDTVVIEESYIDTNTDKYKMLESQGYLVRECEGCEPTYFDNWWGKGGMFDWTHREGSAFWHDVARTPLIEDGVLGHWTDLGEPEIFDPTSWYADTYNDKRHDHPSVHNIFNFYWSKSIFDGYQKLQPEARPWILSRSGTAGSQRFGVAYWSGDIGSNDQSLAAHYQTQMHMAMSGVDYYGSDVGGFHRGDIAPEELHDLYTVWLAGSALFDVPLRPHVENLCNCKETAPALIGDVDSNRFNVQLRYRLIPYYYSLAHHAYTDGEAMFPPLAYYHADDKNVIGLGEVKYIGEYLLARTTADASATQLDTYVPKGTWLNYHTKEWLQSDGQSFPLSTRVDGKLAMPLLAKQGAIIPQMYVDDQTMNMDGKRRDGSERNELVVFVVASETPEDFVLVEDDGVTSSYQSGDVAKTTLRQEKQGNAHVVAIDGTTGSYDGMLSERPYHVALFVQQDGIDRVELNGKAIPVATSRGDYEAMREGAFKVADGHWLAKSDTLSASADKQFRFIAE
jgi:alpha-glucosidase (family GH31 glycosyl hydrolase)